jgi:hypothetical protein
MNHTIRILGVALLAVSGCDKAALEECQQKNAEMSAKATGCDKTMKELQELTSKSTAQGAEAAAVRAALEARLEAREAEVEQLDAALATVFNLQQRVRAVAATRDEARPAFFVSREGAGFGRAKKSDPTGVVETTMSLGPKVMPLVAGMKLYATGETRDVLRVESIEVTAERTPGLKILAAGPEPEEGEAEAGAAPAVAEPGEKKAADEPTGKEEGAGEAARTQLPRCVVLSLDDPAVMELVSSPGEATETSEITNFRVASTGAEYAVNRSIVKAEGQPTKHSTGFYAKATGGAAPKEIGRLELEADDVSVLPIGDTDSDGSAELLLIGTLGDGGFCKHVELDRSLAVLGEAQLLP